MTPMSTDAQAPSAAAAAPEGAVEDRQAPQVMLRRVHDLAAALAPLRTTPTTPIVSLAPSWWLQRDGSLLTMTLRRTAAEPNPHALYLTPLVAGALVVVVDDPLRWRVDGVPAVRYAVIWVLALLVVLGMLYLTRRGPVATVRAPWDAGAATAADVDDVYAMLEADAERLLTAGLSDDAATDVARAHLAGLLRATP